MTTKIYTHKQSIESMTKREMIGSASMLNVCSEIERNPFKKGTWNIKIIYSDYFSGNKQCEVIWIEANNKREAKKIAKAIGEDILKFLAMATRRHNSTIEEIKMRIYFELLRDEVKKNNWHFRFIVCDEGQAVIFTVNYKTQKESKNVAEAVSENLLALSGNSRGEKNVNK